MDNIKPTDHGSYQIQGFQDWFMFSRSKHGLKIDTWLKHQVGALKLGADR